MKLNYIKPAVLFVVCMLVFSCMDKKEYEMELTFQREQTGELLYENNRVLMRIDKVIGDAGTGNKPDDVAVRAHAAAVIQKRDASLDSVEAFIALVDNIKKIKNLEIVPTEFLALVEYYQEKLKNESDLLVFQKLINVYLTLENNILMYDLAKVSGSCSWGLGHIAHVSKTTDTISKGQAYELAVMPDTYDYRFSSVKDDCKISVYKNETLVDMKSTILKKGSAYLITLNPTEPGNYRVHGGFTQSVRFDTYSIVLIFGDTFVVK